MRLVIDAPAYATAADAFTSANQVAAIQYDALVGKLGSYAGMAGDDATSAQFAAAYDEAAAEAVSALADLVPSFANLGRLAGQSATNHRAANASSVLAGNLVYDGTWVPGSEILSVLPTAPPSSLGGDSATGFSDKENWILDHIEGFFWPNADTDLLRDAAHVWRSAADGLDGLTDHCRDAACSLQAQRSPEIPLAIAAADELSSAIGEIAGQIAALAGSCEEYAAQVDARRDEIRALLREILQMVVEGLVISAAIGLITGGAGAVAGTSAVVARVVAQAPRFAAILAALRTAVATSTAYLRSTHTALRASRLRLAKFTNARLAMRNEVGQLGLEDDAIAALRAWEGKGHVIEKHVGKGDTALLRRMRDEPWIEGASSFPTEASAARVVASLLRRNRGEIEAWLSGKGRALSIRGQFDDVVGRRADASGTVSDVKGALAYLVRDAEQPGGFWVHTAYPIP